MCCSQSYCMCSMLSSKQVSMVNHCNGSYDLLLSENPKSPYRWSSHAHSWAFPGRKISQGPTTDSRHNHQDHFSTEMESLQTARTRPLGQDYLQLLQKFQRWKYPKRSVQVGDVVLLKDSELFLRSCYPQDLQGTLQAFRHSAGSATGSRADDSFPGPGGCSGLKTFHKVN